MNGKPFENVAESYPIYDTLVISPIFYGSELSNRGWFTTFAGFAAQEQHRFYKDRTLATASLAYCNKETVDAIDFAYEAYTIGVAFISPGPRVLSDSTLEGSFAIHQLNSHVAHWWETELPRHCSLELKVGQDTVLEINSMMASPGYGPVGDGASFEHDLTFRRPPNGATNAAYSPVMNFSVSQGTPDLNNRWILADFENKKGLGIPRGQTVEAIITVSQFARNTLSQFVFSPFYPIGGVDGTDNYYHYPARFMIQVSLLGKRLVQQRAQLHF